MAPEVDLPTRLDSIESCGVTRVHRVTVPSERMMCPVPPPVNPPCSPIRTLHGVAPGVLSLAEVPVWGCAWGGECRPPQDPKLVATASAKTILEVVRRIEVGSSAAPGAYGERGRGTTGTSKRSNGADVHGVDTREATATGIPARSVRITPMPTWSSVSAPTARGSRSRVSTMTRALVGAGED